MEEKWMTLVDVFKECSPEGQELIKGFLNIIKDPNNRYYRDLTEA